MIYLVLICLIIIGFLGFKLYQKQTIDRSELANYKEEISKATQEWQKILDNKSKAATELENIKSNTTYEQYKLDECRKDLQSALDMYQDITDNKLKEIDISIESQRQKREQELINEFEARKAGIELMLNQQQHECDQQIELLKTVIEAKNLEAENKIKEYETAIEEQRQRFESIQRPLIEQEKERQDKLYYTIQLPEEYREDIDYLLNVVSPHVRHPDVLNKLIWSNYVRPYLDDLCKRTDIRDEPGIYKITHIESGKAYIGKSTNIKKRIQDHMKSVVGVESIADQAVHHEILKSGFWNWTIEVITYCDKNKLSELEKYYIDFFKTQEHGFNKTGGG